MALERHDRNIRNQYDCIMDMCVEVVTHRGCKKQKSAHTKGENNNLR